MEMKYHFSLRRSVALILAVMLLFSTVSLAFAAFEAYQTISMDGVNLRKKASSSSTILKRIKQGDVVTVTGKSGKYYQLQFDGAEGYALIAYVDGTANDKDPEPDGTLMQAAPVSVTSYPYDTVTLGYVKLRKKAGRTADVIRTLAPDSLITVYKVENGFAYVEHEGKKGYVYAPYVNLANIPTPTPVPEPTVKPGAEKYLTVKKGDSGATVKALQEVLIELGYLEKGSADGKFGAKTESALKTLQKRNGRTQTGVADQELQLLLYEGTPKDVKGYRQYVKTLAPISGAVISLNHRGDAVLKAQQKLYDLGYLQKVPDGTCDEETVTAIYAFERNNQLEVDGSLSATDQNLLYSSFVLDASVVVTPTPTPVPEMPKDTVRPGDKSDDAKLVQQRLKELGYYTGKVNGTFNDASVKALQKFQEANGLTPDGVCGIQTRGILYAAHPVYAVPTALPVELITTPAPTMAPITQENTVTIKAGSQGEDVRRLQIRLQELGYYTSRQDGICLSDDITAIRAFQKTNGLTVDGKAGFKTQSLLFSAQALPAQTVESETASSSTDPVLRYGSSGAAVLDLQNRLITLGYLADKADGKFGLNTRAAVVAFQKANNLSPDGVAGAKTLEKLNSSKAEDNKVPYVTLREGSTHAAVKDLQNRLITLGYLTGKADGIFGTKTTLALISFQKANKLTADGIMGKKTTKALNSTGAVSASGNKVETTTPSAPSASGVSAASVRYANWYQEVRAKARKYPNVTVYDFTTGISYRLNIFSNGAHADAEPITADDTAKMNQAFGKTTWTPKPVWIIFSDGTIYMASTHNTPHDTYHIRDNNFNGHVCIHFPRTEAQVTSIGPYATSHQKAIDLGWEATQKRAGK